MDEKTAALYRFDVKEVDGDSVSGDNIADTRFRRNGRHEIRYPNFSGALKRVGAGNGWVIDILRKYVLGHEIEVEAGMQPRNERQHVICEVDYLESLRENGRMPQYLVGLAMHNLRRKYGDRTGFSTRVFDYLEDSFKWYAKKIDAIEPVLEKALVYA